MLKPVYDEDEEFAYIHLRGNRYIRIGKKEEVIYLDQQQIAVKLLVSLAFAEYNQLEFKDYLVH